VLDEQELLTCGRLDGLCLPVLAQNPLEHLKEADRGHHKGTFLGHQANEMFGLRSIGEDFNLSRGIHHHPLGRHRRSPSR
jgi:hypothetical protein